MVDELKAAGRGVRRADGGAGEARVAQAQPRLHLRHLQRLRRPHPWVGAENIRPKSVAREMYRALLPSTTTCASTGCSGWRACCCATSARRIKALAQSVPARYRSPEVDEVTLTLASLVRGVDASLLEEWEALRDPSACPARRSRTSRRPAPAAPPCAAARPICCATRARWPPASAPTCTGCWAPWPARTTRTPLLALRCPDPAEPASAGPPNVWPRPWAPTIRSIGAIVTTPAARHPSNTSIEPDGDRRWRVQQRLHRTGARAHDDWAIHAIVDLTEGVPSDGPLIELDTASGGLVHVVESESRRTRNSADLGLGLGGKLHEAEPDALGRVGAHCPRIPYPAHLGLRGDGLGLSRQREPHR